MAYPSRISVNFKDETLEHHGTHRTQLSCLLGLWGVRAIYDLEQVMGIAELTSTATQLSSIIDEIKSPFNVSLGEAKKVASVDGEPSRSLSVFVSDYFSQATGDSECEMNNLQAIEFLDLLKANIDESKDLISDLQDLSSRSMSIEDGSYAAVLRSNLEERLQRRLQAAANMLANFAVAYGNPDEDTLREHQTTLESNIKLLDGLKGSVLPVRYEVSVAEAQPQDENALNPLQKMVPHLTGIQVNPEYMQVPIVLKDDNGDPEANTTIPVTVRKDDMEVLEDLSCTQEKIKSDIAALGSNDGDKQQDALLVPFVVSSSEIDADASSADDIEIKTLAVNVYTKLVGLLVRYQQMNINHTLANTQDTAEATERARNEIASADEIDPNRIKNWVIAGGGLHLDELPAVLRNLCFILFAKGPTTRGGGTGEAAEFVEMKSAIRVIVTRMQNGDEDYIRQVHAKFDEEFQDIYNQLPQPPSATPSADSSTQSESGSSGFLNIIARIIISVIKKIYNFFAGFLRRKSRAPVVRGEVDTTVTVGHRSAQGKLVRLCKESSTIKTSKNLSASVTKTAQRLVSDSASIKSKFKEENHPAFINDDALKKVFDKFLDYGKFSFDDMFASKESKQLLSNASLTFDSVKNSLTSVVGTKGGFSPQRKMTYGEWARMVEVYKTKGETADIAAVILECAATLQKPYEDCSFKSVMDKLDSKEDIGGVQSLESGSDSSDINKKTMLQQVDRLVELSLLQQYSMTSSESQAEKLQNAINVPEIRQSLVGAVIAYCYMRQEREDHSQYKSGCVMTFDVDRFDLMKDYLGRVRDHTSVDVTLAEVIGFEAAGSVQQWAEPFKKAEQERKRLQEFKDKIGDTKELRKVRVYLSDPCLGKKAFVTSGASASIPYREGEELTGFDLYLRDKISELQDGLSEHLHYKPLIAYLSKFGGEIRAKPVDDVENKQIKDNCLEKELKKGLRGGAQVAWLLCHHWEDIKSLSLKKTLKGKASGQTIQSVLESRGRGKGWVGTNGRRSDLQSALQAMQREKQKDEVISFAGMAESLSGSRGVPATGGAARVDQNGLPGPEITQDKSVTSVSKTHVSPLAAGLGSVFLVNGSKEASAVRKAIVSELNGNYVALSKAEEARQAAPIDNPMHNTIRV